MAPRITEANLSGIPNIQMVHAVLFINGFHLDRNILIGNILLLDFFLPKGRSKTPTSGFSSIFVYP